MFEADVRRILTRPPPEAGILPAVTLEIAAAEKIAAREEHAHGRCGPLTALLLEPHRRYARSR